MPGLITVDQAIAITRAFESKSFPLKVNQNCKGSVGDGDDNVIDDIVKEIENVTRLVNDSFAQKVYHEAGHHFVWEWVVLLSILVIVAVSIVGNLICGCSNCRLIRENATLGYRLRYRTG